MKIELLDYNKKLGVMQVLLKGSDGAFVNLIRRFGIDEVPTLAVEDVSFRDNSSALYDEIVAHRLGLTPIKTDLKSYDFMDDCTCKGEGCSKCQLILTLKSSKKGVVEAGEAKSQDPKCVFVHEGMPIVKLATRQKIEIEATAVLGRGKNHVKWSPGLVYFKRQPIIKIEKQPTEEQRKTIVNACGDIVSTNGKLKVDENKLYRSLSFDLCVGTLEKAGVNISDSDNYILTVEGWGQLDCKEILERATDEILRQLDLLDEQIT
jgi:DNA-directed RNA polymerase subunit D